MSEVIFRLEMLENTYSPESTEAALIGSVINITKLVEKYLCDKNKKQSCPDW